MVVVVDSLQALAEGEDDLGLRRSVVSVSPSGDEEDPIALLGGELGLRSRRLGEHHQVVLEGDRVGGKGGRRLPKAPGKAIFDAGPGQQQPGACHEGSTETADGEPSGAPLTPALIEHCNLELLG